MNAAHLHLALNHIPVVGSLMALGLFIASLRSASETLKKAALWGFVAVALLTLPAFFTGEPAEDQIKNRPGISESLIEEHEEAATAAAVAMFVLGGVALGILWFLRRHAFPHWGNFVILIFSLATVGLMARAANLGGKISHPEIRDAASGAELK